MTQHTTLRTHQPPRSRSAPDSVMARLCICERERIYQTRSTYRTWTAGPGVYYQGTFVLVFSGFVCVRLPCKKVVQLPTTNLSQQDLEWLDRCSNFNYSMCVCDVEERPTSAPASRDLQAMQDGWNLDAEDSNDELKMKLKLHEPEENMDCSA